MRKNQNAQCLLVNTKAIQEEIAGKKNTKYERITNTNILSGFAMIPLFKRTAAHTKPTRKTPLLYKVSLSLSKYFFMLVIDDHYLTATGYSEAELKWEIAVMLFQKEKLSLRKAAALANTHWLTFMKELDRRQIALHYDESLL